MTLDNLPTLALVAGIAVLVLFSAYFSGSETAMMALNRYRLRHLVRENHAAARRAHRLLERPDRLLGVILLGNNLVNFLAASLATVIGLRLLGDVGVAIAPVVLTVVFLVFAEVAPKTIAAQFPERIAFPSAYVLDPLLRVLYPVVWLLNAASNALLLPLQRGHSEPHDRLSMEELRTVLHESARLPIHRQNMLLGILDLERVTVDDIMVPRQEIVGIDLDDDMSEILATLRNSQHTRLPVYRGNVNNVEGVLHLRNAARLLALEEPTKEDLLRLAREPYFVPEGTPLHTQLVNFQKQQRRIGIVVDEYGEVQGIVTLEDILEEIVGEFTTDYAANIEEIHPLGDGSYYIDGKALLREINRTLDWSLPTDGPKTLNGLMLEHLEMIPEANVCIEIDGYRLETVQIADNAIRTIRASKAPSRETPAESRG